MYYELYADRLWLLNFVMNLFCLELVNLFMMQAVSRKKVILGSMMGAFIYVGAFFISVPGWIKIVIVFPLSVFMMISFVFRPKQLKGYVRVAKLLLAEAFLMGGALICFVPSDSGLGKSITGILGISTIVFMEISIFLRNKRKSCLCRVELIGKGAKLTVNALMDTGNSLTEPVSGKPVCILEKAVFDGLWRTGGPEGIRMIPYHSVGKKSGILYGYPIPEIRIDHQGIIGSYKNIYVGIIDENISCSGGYRMILNPMIFEEGKKII